MDKVSFFKCLAAAGAYFAGIAPLVSIVLIFILVDFATGLYAAYIKKIKIESHKIRKTIEKLVFYSVAILLGYAFEIHIAEWSHLSQIISGFIAATELFSIFENIYKITGLNLATKLKEVIGNMLTKKTKSDTSEEPKA